MSKTENLLSIDKKSKKKLKLYNPEANENKEALEDIPFIATAFTDVIKYLLIYGALLIFTSFSLIYFIINSILFYILFSIMTVNFF